ncbi:MAG: hypothetical protein L0K70_06295, partial [Bifidobacterium crudilactis]|nr:hypothetical protein [Bifidobacterium crudilactis]
MERYPVSPPARISARLSARISTWMRVHGQKSGLSQCMSGAAQLLAGFDDPLRHRDFPLLPP